ncbi:MAG TPA: DNA-directed RNA polymerase subunit beta, partial [bacterium]|nr:DNA-directed RNA polymerase subunit beta [bacterium]
LVQASIIPNRGAWLEFENDLKNIHFVLIDRKRKIPVTCLLRAFGLSTDEQIMGCFAQAEQVNLTKRFSKKNLVGKMAGQTVADQTTGKVICERGDELSDDQVEELKDSGNENILIVDGDESRLTFLKETLTKDPSHDQESALLEIYQHLRPGEPPVLKNAQALVENLFSRSRRYDLSRVGRYRMNKKLGLDVSLDEVTLSLADLIGVVQYMLNLEEGRGLADDIDHLGNRRVRTIGELLEGQIRIGLARMERSIREKMGILDLENIMPRNLINAKPITAAINEFFGRSQLSQFLDQINPLAELTHKRRLSALGPGGLNRERAGFEVRDVHHTHYGRICPIETPEGPNIGLIFSLATFGQINPFGFIETPYRKVEKGKVAESVEFLTADDEDECIIAQANTPVEGNRLAEDTVLCRHRGEFPLMPPTKVDYMDISPMQLVSVSAALIPFLEHDDANRALMGSNMQRQAVPLLKTEAPLIATGVEHKAAKDSGVV